MKKLIVICAAVIAAATTYGQGTVTFANLTPTATTYHVTTNRNLTGPASGDASGAGQFIYGFFTGTGVNPLTFTPQGYATNGSLSGRFANTPLVTIDAGAPSTSVSFQIRGWSAALGNDWATVSTKIQNNWYGAANPTATVDIGTTPRYFGYSTIGSTTLGGTTDGGPIPAGTLFGSGTGNITGFVLNEIRPVPEPSTIALGALGLMGVLFIRRRK